MKNYATQFIGKEVEIKIDQPLGSKHPEHGFVYKTNYDYVLGTKAPDIEEIDAYMDVSEPVEEYKGKCIAVVHCLNDDDNKLVVVPDSAADISDDKILKAINFQERFFEVQVIRI